MKYLVCLMLAGCTGGYLTTEAVKFAENSCSVHGGMKAIGSQAIVETSNWFRAYCNDGTTIVWTRGELPK